MSNEQYIDNLLSASNIDDLEATEFAKIYIKKLVSNIVTYVNSDMTVGKIEYVKDYSIINELSQEITGIPGAYCAIDGSETALAVFAEDYSKLGITEFGMLAKEALLDFLNLHNGLFVVLLSKMNIYELSLNVPVQSDHKYLGDREDHILVIPISFQYGTVKFILGEFTDGINKK